jgi:hypothetical protein
MNNPGVGFKEIGWLGRPQQETGRSMFTALFFMDLP